MKGERSMTTEELIVKLGKKYPSPAYAFITQIRNGTGYARSETRTADAMAMSLWPSRGIYLEGFELKVSRSDWLHELKQPEKAEEMVKYCDYWYVVVPDDTIVKMEELPKNWGLMIANGRGGSIKVIKEAPLLSHTPVDRLFLASIFRNITERMVAKDLIEPLLKDARIKGKEAAGNETQRYMRDFENLEKKVRAFEKASGVMIVNEWQDMGNIGHAVKSVLQGKDKHAHKRLIELHEKALKIAEYCKGEMENYEI